MITREQFVGALSIQHDFHAVLGRQAEHAVLSVNAGAAKWLVLDFDQSIQISDEIGRLQAHLVDCGAGSFGYQIGMPFFADHRVVGGKGKRVNVCLRIDDAHRSNNGRRIDAAGQRRTDGYVAAQMESNAVEEQLSRLPHRFGKRAGPIGNSGRCSSIAAARRVRPCRGRLP